MPGDDNTAAAAGLANVSQNLRNNLFQWLVQKPAIQAQTRQENNEADISGVQAKAAQREFAKSQLTIDPDAVVDAAHAAASPTMPDVQPMPMITPPSLSAPTQPKAADLPDPDLAPAIKAPAQADDDYDPTPQYMANGKTVGPYKPPVGDSVTPGSTASPTPNLSRTSPNLASTAGAPQQGDQTSNDADKASDDAGQPASAQASLPPVNIDAQVAPPLAKEDLLTTPFYDLPKAAQTEILRQGREQMKAAGFKITDQELVQQYNENQAKAMPPITPYSHPGNLVLTRIGEKGPEFVNADLAGGASSAPGNQQYHYDALTGQNVENKNFWTDDVIQANRNKLTQQDIAAGQLQQVADVLKRNPGVVGAVSGSKAGNLVREAASALGYSGPYTDANTLRTWLAEQMKTIMGSVSNVKNQMEFENLQNAITDPKWTVANWKDAVGRASKALQAERGSLRDNFAQHGLSPYADSSLPPVSIDQTSVTAPGGGQNIISTEAQFAALPKGAHFTWQYPDGTTKDLVK